MVKTRWIDYEASKSDCEQKQMETMEPTAGDNEVKTTKAVISTKALQEILVESERYVSPPGPLLMTTTSMNYTPMPTLHRLTTQPRFGTPAFKYAKSFVDTNTTAATSTPVTSEVKYKTTTSDSFEIKEGVVTIGYERLVVNPAHWEPKRIMLDEFKTRYGKRKVSEKKRVMFSDEQGITPKTDELELTFKDEEFIKKVEDWATANKKLTEMAAYDEFTKIPETKKRVHSKQLTQRDGLGRRDDDECL